VLAQAETIWVFVDLATGRRRSIPAELLEAFDPMPEEREVRRSLGLAT
jgi:acyl-CoA thioesterase FadM